jgi:hypothetical protein
VPQVSIDGLGVSKAGLAVETAHQVNTVLLKLAIKMHCNWRAG